jgi:FtsP/CotA-like multicopper oxidase with cupredoxin domain
MRGSLGAPVGRARSFAHRPVGLWAALVALLAIASRGAAQRVQPPPGAAERVRANDNRAAAGTMRGGVLTLRLAARVAMWHPDGDGAPGAPTQAFAEEGSPARIPGPLVRVPAGTEAAVTVRNALADTLRVYGLRDRPAAPGAAAAAAAPLVLAPGEARGVRLRLDAPGTYFYWGTSTGRTLDFRTGSDAQLTGAIVVDSARTPHGPARDRVFVIGMWTDTTARSMRPRRRVLAVINGRSWPHTERLAYAVGDSVRWRLINASADLHPMHLHGFYFRVDARGDGLADTVYGDGVARLANTESLNAGHTRLVTWVPERAGNWLFHCHVPEHFGLRGPLGTPPAAGHGAHAAQAGPAGPAAHAMSGLVLGVAVGDAGRPRAVAPRAAGAPRALRLLVRANAASTRSAPHYGFAAHARGSPEPPPDSGRRAGAPLVLTRGAPVRITVVNRLAEPTAVHWHGIELESLYDGVPGFSGMGSQTTPMIAPGDSFEVRFTPPRAGTFIYHTHVDEERQQDAGLAGPLLVMEPGARWDPARDIPVLLGSPGDFDAEVRTLAVNGRVDPPPLRIEAGRPHRLRIINMSARRAAVFVELRRDSTRLAWTPLAKDGADLPPAFRRPVPARHQLGIGETLDVEVTADTRGGRLALLVMLGPRANNRLLVRWPVLVGARPPDGPADGPADAAPPGTAAQPPGLVTPRDLQALPRRAPDSRATRAMHVDGGAHTAMSATAARPRSWRETRRAAPPHP